MIKLDNKEKHIYMTRKDEAVISFYAEYEDGTPFLAEMGDVLKFAVSKKYGGNKTLPVGFEIENKFDDKFEDASPSREEFEEDKTSFFTFSEEGGYNRCSENDAYSPDTQYYINTMWDIWITPEMTDGMKFADYRWDLQLNDYTIIGKEDEIEGITEGVEPIFTLWGEVV